VEGAVRFSNNPRVRGDGVLLADLAGAIATDDGARIVFSLTGLGRKDPNGRSFSVALAMTLESDDERYLWVNDALCIAEASVVGRHVKMRTHRLLGEPT
jgi:hypothetical protein